MVVRIDESRLLRVGEPLCGVLAALLALGGAVAGTLGAHVLSVRLGIFATVAAVIVVVLNRRAAAVAGRRRLDPIQRAGLLADLLEAPPLPITVSALHADDEAIGVAKELLEVLRDAKWPARGIRLDQAPDNASNAGVTVAISVGDDPPPNEAELLLRALTRTSGRLRDRRSVELFIGRRP
jgi:hypothetical protein